MRDPQPDAILRFDRGTILLEASSNALGAQAASGTSDLLWDPRVAAHRAPGHRHAAVSRDLRRMKIPFLDPIPTERAAPLAARMPLLRPYQVQALDAWEVAGRRGVAVLPTGSGKTHLALGALSRIAGPTLVLVPTRVLLSQWVQRIGETYDGPVGVFGDGERTLEAVTVCTFESAYRHMDDFGHRFALLVVDEVHHLGCGLRAEALEMCTAPARLGLTATPAESPESQARLHDLVGPLVCHYTIGHLSGRYLAVFDLLRLFVDLEPEERSAYDEERAAFQTAYREFRRLRRNGEWRDFVALASASAVGRRALLGFHRARRVVSVARAKLRLAEDLLARHGEDRSLVFTADNAAAYALSRALLLPAVTCHIRRKERSAILDALRDGRLRAVISARVLNEGIDLPDARVGIILGGTLGPREHVQRVGRLLRPQNGKRAVVYEVVARDTYELGHAERRQRQLVA
jgi:superfamily II DNA or RNA helicase